MLVAPATASKGTFPSAPTSFWSKFDHLNGRGQDLSDRCLGTLKRDLVTFWPMIKGLRPQRFFFKLNNQMTLPMLVRWCLRST